MSGEDNVELVGIVSYNSTEVTCILDSSLHSCVVSVSDGECSHVPVLGEKPAL